MPYSSRWYTLLHAGNPGDLPYYLEICRDAESVLELGCGVGRIALPLVAAGAAVTAVDISDEMVDGLKRAAERLPEASRQKLTILRRDMRQLSLDRWFDRVIIPYNGLLCLLCENDVRRALSEAARHLKPGGLLVFDIYDVPLPEPGEDLQGHDADDFEHIATLEDGDWLAEVFERSIPVADPKRFDTRYRYDLRDRVHGESESFEYEIAQRCIYKEELAGLLDAVGLELISVTGDFLDAPVTDETLQVVVAARNPSGRD